MLTRVFPNLIVEERRRHVSTEEDTRWAEGRNIAGLLCRNQLHEKTEILIAV